MDLSALMAHASAVHFAAMGTDATVTVPHGAAVTTRVIWLPPVERTDLPGQEMGRLGRLQRLAIPKADIESAPAGTLIVAAPVEGGTARTWRVERLFDVVAHDYIGVSVTPARSEG